MIPFTLRTFFRSSREAMRLISATGLTKANGSRYGLAAQTSDVALSRFESGLSQGRVEVLVSSLSVQEFAGNY
jgi:hypothetical protein